MGGDHFIFGSTTDYLTGKTVPDTHDERIRQKIARLLVDEKGYHRSELESGVELTVAVDGDTGTALIDFVVRIDRQAKMIVVYGPGSLISRQRAALASARLLDPESIIPYTVITNGEDAHVMDTETGKVLKEGFDSIFSRAELQEYTGTRTPKKLPEERREKEERILFTLDILTRRECDSYTCRQC